MQKPIYNDILIVLVLSLISMILLLVSNLNLFTLTTPLIYIPYLLLLLFLPGYSLLAASDPEFTEYKASRRIVAGIIVSLIISILLAVLVTFTPIGFLNSLIVYIVGGFTIILSLIAILRRKRYHYVRFIEPDEPLEGENLETEKLESSNPFTRMDNIKDTLFNINPFNNPQPDLTGSPEFSNDESEKLKGYDEDKKIEEEDALMQDVPPEQKQPETSYKETEPDMTVVDEMKSENDPDTKETSPNSGDGIKPSRGFPYLDLLAVLILTIVCTIFVVYPGLINSTLDGVVGLPLMVILPGYALIAVIYPRKDDLTTIIRLILSFGVSYFLTSVIGLALNYTQFDNSLNPVLLSLAAVTFILIIAAFVVRLRSPEGERLPAGVDSAPGEGTSSFGGSRNRNILVLGVAMVIVMVLVTPTAINLLKPSSVVAVNNTEFYITGPDGQNISTTYPQDITPGDNGTVTIVLVNRENVDTTYRIVITSDDNVMDEINVTLKPNETKQIPYTFTAGEIGSRNLEFRLYKLPDLDSVYRSLSFLLNIVETATEPDTSETATDSTESSDTSTPDNTPSPAPQEPSQPAEPSQPETPPSEPEETEYVEESVLDPFII